MKKGFTLVELLAVIVILAIIAIITIPMIKGVIDKVKMKSLEDSVYGLKNAAELYFSSNEKIETTEFICSDNGCISNTGKKLDYKGRVEGRVKLFSDGKVSICLTDDNYASSILASDKKATSKMGGCDEETYEISEVIAIEKYNELKSGVDLLKNSLYNKTIISSKENTFEQIANEIDSLDLNQGEAENKKQIVDSLRYSDLGITEDMSWNEIAQILLDEYPEWNGNVIELGNIWNPTVYSSYSTCTVKTGSDSIGFEYYNNASTASYPAIGGYVSSEYITVPKNSVLYFTFDIYQTKPYNQSTGVTIDFVLDDGTVNTIFNGAITSKDASNTTLGTWSSNYDFTELAGRKGYFTISMRGTTYHSGLTVTQTFTQFQFKRK